MTDKPEVEFDLKEYLDGKFAEQTKLHDARTKATNAHFESIKDMLKTSIEANSKAIDSHTKAANANVESVKDKAETSIEANSKAIDAHTKAANANVESVKDKAETSIEANVESVKDVFKTSIDGINKRFNDLMWFIGVLFTIIWLALGAAYISNQNHSHDTEKTQEV